MKKTILILVIILLGAYIVNSLRTVYDLWQKQSLILAAQHDLSSSQQENKSLREKLKVVQDPNFIEYEARNKLFLTKPGEYTVFLPSPSSKEGQILFKQIPNWQQWWNLFLY